VAVAALREINQPRQQPSGQPRRHDRNEGRCVAVLADNAPPVELGGVASTIPIIES
jgi:hypothetical protein